MSREHYLNQVKKCVTFIFVKQNDKFYPIGTGFFVGIEITGKEVEIEDISNYHLAIYLATALHVLKDENDKFYNEIYIRLNRKNGLAGYISIDLDEMKKKIMIHTHDDKNVDIATFILYPSHDEFNYISILTNTITSKAFVNEKIHEGDDVFYAGLFANYYGKEINHPILRFGKVSLITNELIEINRYHEPQKLAHIYLFELQSYSGNSGSPVFYQASRLREDGRIAFQQPEIHLVGILKGHYNDIRMKKILDFKDDVLEQLNNGIAMITPSYLLREILFSENASNERIKIAKDQGLI